MAELVGVFAASHSPLIARDWAILDKELKAKFSGAFRAIGKRIEQVKPDILIEIAPDHWTNFFIDNLPSVCIGVGAEHAGPPEPFMKDFLFNLKGHPAFAKHLLETAIASDFEPSVSHKLTLDHGFCIPLMRMELLQLPSIVPVMVNALEPPMPSISRCLSWGNLLARSIATFPEDLRIAILASGGLSHSIGEETMGEIDETFDRDCIKSFRSSDRQALITSVETALRGAGNGGHEVRNWVVAHGAAEGKGFELLDYIPSPEVYVGCAFAEWHV